MFEKGYPFRYINTQILPADYPHIKVSNYSFTTAKKKRYIVLVDKYEYQVFVVKFYEATHKQRLNKFNVILNDFDCSRVLRTVLNIATEELRKEPLASFAFAGVYKEGDEKITTANTQRHRILGTQTFLHSYEQRSNCYLLVNKGHPNPVAMQSLIVDMFAKHFEELSHL